LVFAECAAHGNQVGRGNEMGRKLIMLCMMVGAVAGGYVPTLWGDGGISLASLLTSTLGGILGIIVGHKLSRS
jgi:uncharacterized membrane protein YeaQ/YmgE (transglycosylase-associated protein family)